MNNSEKSGSVEEVALFLKDKRSIILAPHMNIDGDDLGAMIALKTALEATGREVFAVSHDPIPKNIAFLKGSEDIVFCAPDKICDCVILMECTSINRLPEAFKPYELARNVLNLDHHKGNAMRADLSWIDTSASALGEMVFHLLKEMKIELNEKIAAALYLSIFSDTGGFRHSNTSSFTHKMASQLFEYGIDTHGISKHFLDNSINVARFTGELMSQLRDDCAGRLVWAEASLAQMLKYSLEKKDMLRVTDCLNSIEGCVVFCLFTEQEDGEYAVSLRSADDDCPIRSFAVKYGGGGHDVAAGCMIPDRHEIENLLLSVKEFLEDKYQMDMEL